jgi:hypothetical protein
VEGLDVWPAFRYTNPRKAQLTPTLHATINDREMTCTTFAKKVEAFHILFPKYPRTPPASDTHSYPQLPWRTFSTGEIKITIHSSSHKKGPGPDGITFACLCQAYASIATHFNHLSTALGSMGHYP